MKLVILMVLLTAMSVAKVAVSIDDRCFGGWTALSRGRSFAAAAKRSRRLSPGSPPAWTVAALRGNARSSFRLKSSNWLRKASGKTPQNGQNIEGDVVWAELDPTQGHEQSGRHPVLVLSQDVFNERSGTVIACALTSQEPPAGFPLTLELTGAKLPTRSWVKISQIRTLSMKRIGKKLGRTSVEELEQRQMRRPTQRLFSFEA